MRSRLLLALCASLLACSPSQSGESTDDGARDPSAAQRGAEDARPDVLLVVLDTVRADRTSAYGYPRATTPTLELLARQGVLFEDATAPGSWTVPSHASLFTGRLPREHGAHLLAPGVEAAAVHGMHMSTMRDDLPTLAERFRTAGYRTAAIVSNQWLSPEVGLMRGFDEVQSFVKDTRTLEAALALIEEAHEQPLLLFVNVMSAHSPYHAGQGEWGIEAPERLVPETAPAWLRPMLKRGRVPGVQLGRTTAGGDDVISAVLSGRIVIPEAGFELLSQLYDAGVRDADAVLGRLFAAWARGRPTSIVAVTSDHGEAIGEHGLLEHRGSVYTEVVRIPLVVAHPGVLSAGLRVEQPVQLQALYPTLLDLAGLEPDAPGSLVAATRGELAPGPIVSSAWPIRRWARSLGGRFTHTWHLYRVAGEALVWSDSGEAAELYSLPDDPGMQRDLALEQPGRVAALLAEARAHRDAQHAAEPVPVELTDALRAELQALGYEVGAPLGPLKDSRSDPVPR